MESDSLSPNYESTEVWKGTNIFLYNSGEGRKFHGEMIPGTMALIKRVHEKGGLYLSWKRDEESEDFFQYQVVDINDWSMVDELPQRKNLNSGDSGNQRSSLANERTGHSVWLDLGEELRKVTVDFGNSSRTKSNTHKSQHPYMVLSVKSQSSSNSENSSEVELAPFYFHNGLRELTQFIKILNRYFWLQRNPSSNLTSDTYLVLDHHSAVMKSIETARNKNMKVSQPFSSLLAGLSRTTNLIKGEISEQFSLARRQETAASGAGSDKRPRRVIQLLQEEEKDQGNLDLHGEKMLENTDGSIYAFSKTKYQPNLITIETMDRREWENFFDEQGVIRNPKNVFNHIYTVGVSEDIRSEVWMFLLKFYPVDSTHVERLEIVKTRKQRYESMKQQWMVFSPEQEANFTEYVLRKSIIDKDVSRTDKSQEFYKGKDSPNSVKLRNILMTYCMFNFDLGYVQGMSDLLAPILYLFQDESITFWCFVEVMNQYGANFHINQNHILTLISIIRSIIQFLWPDLHNYLKVNGADTINFVFSWVLINFKRQFSYEDIFVLWEKYFTQSLTVNYSVFLAAAIIGSEKDTIMRSKLNGDHILSYFNRINGNISVYTLVEHTEKIIKALLNTKYLPPRIAEQLITV